jgi:hypothetical protein
MEFVGVVDLSRDAVVLARFGCVGFSEVMQPINAAVESSLMSRTAPVRYSIRESRSR